MFTFSSVTIDLRRGKVTVVYKCKVLNLVLFDTQLTIQTCTLQFASSFFLISIIILSRGIQFGRASLNGALALQN